jgi:molybdenum cofactor synthesis domain-containing protein
MAGNSIVTAGLLVIGDEILSGRTKDKNIGYIAEYLTTIGIDLKEVRVVPDDEDEIVAAVNALRKRFTYLFTTGGIGPTHDDITADSVAKAFGVGVTEDQRIIDMLLTRFKPEDLHEGRRRMARVPNGADLVPNPVSRVPGFRMENVIVMAGIPAVMQGMLDGVAPSLQTGIKMLSVSIRADSREGDIAMPFGAVAKAHPEVIMGSYPFSDERGPNTHLVLRSRDSDKLAAAKQAVEEMLLAVRGKAA